MGTERRLVGLRYTKPRQGSYRFDDWSTVRFDEAERFETVVTDREWMPPSTRDPHRGVVQLDLFLFAITADLNRSRPIATCLSGPAQATGSPKGGGEIN